MRIVSSQAATHYKNQLWSGRAATMGGAYTAISDDPACIYYNPAGIVLSQGNSLSGSANLFSKDQFTYKSIVGSYNWKRESQNLSPNYFALVKKMDQFAFGLGYAITNKIKENQNQIFEHIDTGAGTMNYYSLILNTEDEHYLFSMSGAYQWDSELSFGLTISYSYRKLQRLQNQYIEYANSTVEHAFDFKEIRSKGIKPLLGVMWTPAEKWSLGLATSYDIILTQFSEDVRNKEEKGSNTNSFMRSSSLSKDKPPLEWMLGVAYFPSSSWIFSSNVDYYAEFNNQKNSVINLSLGGEYFLSANHAARFGLYTNRTNVKKYNQVTRNVDSRMDRYGLTSGYSFYSKLNEITLGILYSFGDGQVQPYSGSTSIRDVSYYDVKMILSSTYGF
jgi:long-subunit fatty acid transport protein